MNGTLASIWSPAVTRRVLIVDDDRDFADSTAALLRPRGYDVATAHDTEEARHQAEDTPPQVVLLDIRLKNQNGLELIERLRAACPPVQCLMLTAYADLDTAISALQRGAYDYLRKPVNPRDLFAALDRCFDHLRLQAENAELERQLRQAQKLEAVGRLAGGVAHDFNNVLSTILINVELLQIAAKAHPYLRQHIEHGLQEIRNAADHAAGFTRQLLTFSQHRPAQPGLLDLSSILSEMEPMLRRLVPDHILFELRLQPGIWAIRADKGQLEQIVINLVVNAQDAMPDGGTLRVTTATEQIDADRAASLPGLRHGTHVVLTVSDTGCGMDPQVLARMFEPFFTTKAVGKGTGLGLATVHGIVQASGGHIAAESEVGKGTTFRVYLPAEAAFAVDNVSGASVVKPQRGQGETVLLCEDNPALRASLTRVLEASGYEVLGAAGGTQALRLAAEKAGAVSVLITDLVMPGMNGRELAEKIHQLYPTVNVILTSGYAGETLDPAGSIPNAVFLPKPYQPRQLLELVRGFVDRTPRLQPPST